MRSVIDDAKRVDVAVYAAIAATPTPSLDLAMGRLSRAADYSRLSLASAALLALGGGRGGRQAATMGLASVGVAATAINVVIKPLGMRRRPDREAAEVPFARHVPMPASSSFPSGHTAASRGAAARTRGAGGLLACAHRGALPRRRGGGVPAGERPCAGHHPDAE